MGRSFLLIILNSSFLDDHLNKHEIYDTQTDMHINALIWYMHNMYVPYNTYIQIIHCMIKEYS